MIHLGVNVDHVATLRPGAAARYPDPLFAALIAEQAGADSITIHLREDRRHIQDRDVPLRRGAADESELRDGRDDEMVQDRPADRAPADCCLVPSARQRSRRKAASSRRVSSSALGTVCRRLADAGIRVSLFIDPDRRQLDAAARIGAPAVELHTGAYADAIGEAQAREAAR
jgi:pyridoxine 5-phosphate synthase